jgi:hypothetical protein
MFSPTLGVLPKGMYNTRYFVALCLNLMMTCYAVICVTHGFITVVWVLSVVLATVLVHHAVLMIKLKILAGM